MSQLKYSSLPSYILIILYILTGSIPALGSIDILAPQWVYFGSINFITAIYLIINSDKYLEPLSKIFKIIFLGLFHFNSMGWYILLLCNKSGRNLN